MIVNWATAEHKSQGTVQVSGDLNDLENFWYFDINGEKGIQKTRQLFEELKQIPYKAKEYK
jgi:hypothetical protein